MRISDWSSDVCSSDLLEVLAAAERLDRPEAHIEAAEVELRHGARDLVEARGQRRRDVGAAVGVKRAGAHAAEQREAHQFPLGRHAGRSEEHTSELQSLMRISYAVFCWKKKNRNDNMKTQKNKT